MKRVADNLLPRLGCAAALALAAWAAGAHSDVFVLERAALERGELWRLWTGHLVHGNGTHYAYDVGAAALLFCAFGPALRLLWMAPVIGVGLLVSQPDVEHYYGLSAWLHAWVVAACADEALASRGHRRILAAALLLGALAKATWEARLGASVFTSELDFGGPVLHASHLVGALVGLLPLLQRALWTDRRRGGGAICRDALP
ncbi:MAG: rhombosortase [bacterium]|nr:rhombosortase [bacterium]